MIINNTQANIFKVNGGLADIFANRPAASGSFYVFYSIDTQEIFYDSGSWILLGSGGGAVNIYNSDGTLTGPRDVFCSQHNLRFREVRLIRFDDLSFADSFIIDFSGGNEKIYTRFNNNDVGLKLDFANNFYSIGDFDGLGTAPAIKITGGIGNTIIYTTDNNNNDIGLRFDLYSSIFQVGDYSGVGNTTHLTIDDTNQIIKTQNQNSDIGLKLDFANDVYQIGNSQANFVINSSVPYFQTYMFGGGIFDGLGITATSAILGYNNIGTGTKFVILASGSAIYTVDNNLGTGLRLDFSANDYTFGQFGGSNKTYLKIDDSINLLFTSNQNTNNGLRFEFSNKIYLLGHYNGGNTTYLTIDDQHNLIKTSNQSNDIGLKFDFANENYYFGDFNGISNGLGIFIANSNANKYINIGNQMAITLDCNNLIAKIGDIFNSTNKTFFSVDDNIQLITTSNQGNDIGLKLDFANSIYQLGQLTGGNTTYLTIDDVATYPIQIDGTNILSGTSGGSSGQHLKIKLNGVDYKIKLENP